MLVAALAAGCGDGEETMRPATDADTAGLPQKERDFIACLRKAGINVRVPSAVRRLVKKDDYQRRTRHGVEVRFNLFFYMFDKRQRVTKKQVAAARECERVR